MQSKLIHIILIYTLLFFLPLQGYPARELSFHEFFTEMKNATSFYELDFSLVIYNPVTDSQYTGKKNSFNQWNVNISALVEIERVRFDQRVDLVIGGLVFEKKIIFRNCTFSNFVLEKCLFREGLIVDDCVIRNLESGYCEFVLPTVITGNNLNGQVRFEHCNFTVSPEEPVRGKAGLRIPVAVITQNGPGLQNLLISHSTFKSGISEIHQYYLDLSASQFGNLKIENSLFDVFIDLENSSVLKEFFVTHSIFRKGIDTKNLEINDESVRFDWDQISGDGLSVIKERFLKDSTGFDTKWVTGFSLNPLSDENDFLFRMLKSKYAKFIRAFRTQRDFVNVAKVTQGWKNLENNYYSVKAKSPLTGLKEKGVFRLKIFMNKLLGLVSDHGTNPQKAALCSLMVIVAFSIFFFMVPSRTFPLFSSRFYGNMEMLSRYFSTGNSLRHLLYEYHTEKKIFTEKEDYADFVEANKEQIPFYLRIFAGPFLNFLSKWNRNVYFWLLKRMSFLDGIWSELSFWKKSMKNTFVFMMFITYLTFLCTKRFLWSFLQSLNSFVTFGFGRLSSPKSIGLVLAVLEGFSGWFLMSVFVVSLLFQLLS